MRVVIPAPAAQYVYDDTQYGIVVSNIGNQSASAVKLTVDLPATHTSPSTYVMGTLAGVDPRADRDPVLRGGELAPREFLRHVVVMAVAARPLRVVGERRAAVVIEEAQVVVAPLGGEAVDGDRRRAHRGGPTRG